MKPSLADRLRAVVGPSAVPRVHPDAFGAPRPSGAAMPEAVERESTPDTRLARAHGAAAVLGGVVDERSDGLCIIVDRRYDADMRHGRHRVGDIVGMLRRAEDGLTALRRAWPERGTGMALVSDLAPPPLDGLCTLDLETTGLAGGAGTQAFLIGCARIEHDAIVVRQFLTPGFEFERAQLSALAEWMRDRTHFLTFNGRTFDLPLLEMRFSFNRLAWPWHHLPHLDALHPARRFWRERPTAAGLMAADDGGCSLGVLEKRLGGLQRVGDVPGFEIPARFFQFARDGRAEPLEAVLEHNRIDLLSTLLVSARASMLVVGGPAAAEHGHECLGLGRVYERLDDPAGAEVCFARAAVQAAGLGDPALRAEALRRLALSQRRAGRREEAATSWGALLATRGVPAHLRREAREALAIFHEHRAGDLDAARTLVLDALAEPLDERHRSSAERRLARLDRKLVRKSPGALIPRFDVEPL
ncbi:MAG: ribonuclease H-like domain-containing protein [Acidobacteria bacterium]|nr:ribonuclease H-like domain-containing protein [Acidobacteriota bacterium]